MNHARLAANVARKVDCFIAACVNNIIEIQAISQSVASFSNFIKCRLQRLAGGGFLVRILVFVGWSRILPKFNHPQELVLVVQHVVTISNLALPFVPDMNPISRETLI